MLIYYPIIMKLTLGLLCLILQINILGKGNLAPTSALDQVQNYVLGGIIGGVIYNDDISVVQFILILLIWTLLVLILKYIKSNNHLTKVLIDGRPVLLILNGKILVKQCMLYGVSAYDLILKLRSSGVYHIKNVKRAVMEQNGQLTIIQYGEKDVHYPVILDGQIDETILELINHDKLWLLIEVQKAGYNIDEIYLAEYIAGELYIYSY
ncbi:DUF421 domain-containing protein [Pectinatus cerevisiiphilus]|uniref:Uncharacterized membrane protein YcaP (DUF421 family) n=1 Tax=Pectinatus cerevisiiphilus TaxID=86956 RepID=A0A4R3K7S4_9FIRM|nr:YetF domain-containing protein [Pectinatus cerevisiiphilus]TCS79014.1 uncharacterized membrane protein YcaP (DUF421 family) [Pectinatus cerevisiiphilus]